MKNKNLAFFYFSRTERKGAFILLLLSVILFILPPVVSRLFTEKPDMDFPAFQSTVDTWESIERQPAAPSAEFLDPNKASFDEIVRFGVSGAAARNMISYRQKVGPFKANEDLKKLYKLSEQEYLLLEPFLRIEPQGDAPKTARLDGNRQDPGLFLFDPNTATEATLRQLELPEKAIRAMINYRKKGGHYRVPADLKKIYTLPEEQYIRIAPFIRIDSIRQVEAPDSETEKSAAMKVAYAAAAPESLPVIDVNQASEEEWTLLYGIGKVYSRRIVNFREKLGGFYDPDQVAETFGLPDSVFTKIRPQLRSSPVFRRLNINTADLEQLKSHPYLSWKQAAAIISYREQHGPFRGPDDIGKVLAVPPGVLEKITPYLDF